jgi:hypothetical protein
VGGGQLAAQLRQVRPFGLGLCPAAEAAAHDLRHRHEVVGVAGPDRAALNAVAAVVLLGRQAINEHHLGSHRIAALDVADVEPFDPPGWHRQLEQLGKVLGGEMLLFGAALGPLQFVGGVAFHQFDQLGLLLALGHRQLHPATTPLLEPLADQLLLGQAVLEQ